MLKNMSQNSILAKSLFKHAFKKKKNNTHKDIHVKTLPPSQNQSLKRQGSANPENHKFILATSYSGESLFRNNNYNINNNNNSNNNNLNILNNNNDELLFYNNDKKSKNKNAINNSYKGKDIFKFGSSPSKISSIFKRRVKQKMQKNNELLGQGNNTTNGNYLFNNELFSNQSSMYTAFTESVIGHQIKTPIKMNVNINVNNFFNSTGSKSEQRLNSAQVTRRNKKFIDFTVNSVRNSRKHTHNKHSSELPELTYSSMRKNSFTIEKERKLNESKSIDTMSVLKRQIDNINIDTINIDFDNLPSERNPNTTRTSGRNTSNCDQTFSPSRRGFQSRNNKNSVLKTITSNTITNINKSNTTNNNNITLGTNKDSSIMNNSKKTVKSLKTIFSLKNQIKKASHKKLNRRKSVLIPKSSSRKLYGLMTIKNKLQKHKLKILTILESFESPVEKVKVNIAYNVMEKINSKISATLEKNKIERREEIYSRKREQRKYFNKVILRNLSKMQMYLKYFQLRVPKYFSLDKYLADLLNEIYFGNVVYTMIYTKHVEKRPSRINRNTKLKRKGMFYSITRQYIFHKFEANEWQGKKSKILNGKIDNPKFYTEHYGSMDQARENINLRLSNLVYGANMIAPIIKKTSSKRVSVILPDRAPSKKGTKNEQRSGSRKGTISNGPSRKSSYKNQSPNDGKDSMQKAASAKNGLVIKNKSSIKSRPSIQSYKNEKLNSSIRILSHKDLLKRSVKYNDEEIVEKKNPFNFHIYDQEKEMQTIKTMAKESLIYRTQEIKMKMKENLKNIEDILFFLIKENNFKEFKELVEKYRVDLESTDRNGNTFLIYATACGFKEFVEYLLDSGAYINAQNDDLNTALHIALIFKNFEISDFLLKKGANEKIVNNFGYTPWETLDREVYKVVG